MAEIRWWWTSPLTDEYENQKQEERIEQSAILGQIFNAAPDKANNLRNLINEHFYLPKDVLVGSALMDLTSDSPELSTIVERWLDVEKTWWERTKAVGRGTIRTAFTAFDSLQDEIVKKPTLALQKFLNDKKWNDGVGLAGATLQLLTSRQARNELQDIRKELGPSVGREAISAAMKGEKVNLGEGYFANSTLAEDTDVYKELVGRGADPEEVKKIVQTYYGQDITNSERMRDEGLTIQNRFGTTKLTPAAGLVSNIIEPGTKSYNIVSGVIDGAFTLLADPSILVGSYLAKSGKAVRSLSQADALKGAGIIDKAVRKTVHIPSATDYLANSKGGQFIVDQLIKADNFDTVGRLMKGQGDAVLHKKLKNAQTRQDVYDALIPAIENLEVTKRLDPTSLFMRGNISRGLGQLIGGDYGQAVGFAGAIRKSQSETAIGRMFQSFPVPKLNVKDLNASFFDLKDWMRWAKVDDDIAEPALDKLADLAESRVLNPTKAQSMQNMGDILDIWNDVLTHIGQKFEAINLPPQLVKGIKRWMASVDETHKYFINELGQSEWFPGSKFDSINTNMRKYFGEELDEADAYNIISRVIAKYKKDSNVVDDEVQDLVNQLRDIADSPKEQVTKTLVDEVTSAYYPGAEREALEIADEIGIKTSGRVPYGHTAVDAKIDQDFLSEEILTSGSKVYTMGYKMKPEETIDLGQEGSTFKRILAGKRTSTTRHQGGWVSQGGVPKVGEKIYFKNFEDDVVGVTVTRVSTLPRQLLTSPEYRPLLDDILQTEGWTEVEYASRLRSRIESGRAIRVEFIINEGSRYDSLSPRMKSLNLSDFRGVDEYNAQVSLNKAKDGLAVDLSTDLQALSRKDRKRAEFLINAIEETSKALQKIRSARADLDNQILQVPEKQLKDVDEYGPVYSKLTKDEEQLTLLLTKDREELYQLVPNYRKVDDLSASKDIYDPDYWKQDFGIVDPKGDNMGQAVKYNIDESDATIIFRKTENADGRKLPKSQNLQKIQNYLDNGKWEKPSTGTYLDAGVYQGYKPYVVIEIGADGKLGKQDIQKYQDFLFKNKVKKVNIVGDKLITNDELYDVFNRLMFYRTKGTAITVNKLLNVIEENIDQLRKVDMNDAEPEDILNEVLEEFKNTSAGKSVDTAYEPRATAHLLSEYWDEGYIPMPDARLFLRIFRPMRDLSLRITGRHKKMPVEEYEKLLAKPVADLARIELSADRTFLEEIRRLVGKTRVSIKLDADADSVANISEGMLTMIGDGYMQRIWKPSVLLRPAWVTRVVGEEQVRMWADDLDNVFAHPLSAIAWILGRSPQRNRQLLLKTREKSRDYLSEQWGRGGTDILDESLENSFYHQEAMSNTHNGVLFGINPKRARGFTEVKVGGKGWNTHWASEILQLVDDPLAAKIAAITIDPVQDGQKFKVALDDIKQSFWDGELKEWRMAYVGNADDLGRASKKLILENKAHADSYIDSIVARIHVKTGGTYEAYEIVPGGTPKLISSRDDKRILPAVTDIKNPIRYDIKSSGDKELIAHIAGGGTDKPNVVSIFSKKKNDYQQINLSRKMTRSEFRVYSTWLKNFKTDVLDADLMTFKASRFELGRDKISEYDRVLETFFSTLMGASTNELSRSTAFRQYYWRFIESIYANMDDASRAVILKQAKKTMGIGKNNRLTPGSRAKQYIDSLENMGKADVTKMIGIDDLESVDDLAKAYALNETKSLLYDLNNRHVISDMLRLMFPFAEVYIEIAGTWTRLLKNQKMLFGRKVQRSVEGARDVSIFGENEDEGFFTTDPRTGEEMYNIAGFGLNNKLDRELNPDTEDASVVNPITGRNDLEAPQINTRIEGYASGLNMVAGSIIPGVGPIVQLPASAVLPSTEGIDQAIFPYGRPAYKVTDPSYWVDATLPSWINKLRAANGSTSSPELQRAYANRVKEIQRAMFTTGIYDDSSPEAEQESLERAKTLANSMLKYQAFIQFVMPTGATVKYEYEVGPGGAAFLDPFKAKENDPEHKFFADTLFADAYYQMLAKRGGDRVAAVADFIKMFGFDPTALTTSKSRAIQPTTYTTEGGYFYKQNKELMDRHADVSYYLFPDSPLDEFDYQAWADAFTEGKRIDLSPEEFKRSVRQAQGSLAYENFRRLILDTPYYQGFSLDKKFEALYMYKLNLQEQFPGYGTTSTTPTPLDTDAKIKAFNQLLTTEAGTSVKLPNGETKLVGELDAVQGAMKYIMAREKLLQGLKYQYGANATLYRAEATQQRQYLSLLAKQLMMQYPDFYYIWYDIFRREIEEQTTFGAYN